MKKKEEQKLKSLNAEQLKCVVVYKKHMEEIVIPAIADRIYKRQVAAAKNSHRILKVN